LDSLIGVISLLLLSEKNRSILEAMTKKRPETVLFHTASGLENTGFLKLTSKPLTGHSNSIVPGGLLVISYSTLFT